MANTKLLATIGMPSGEAQAQGEAATPTPTPPLALAPSPKEQAAKIRALLVESWPQGLIDYMGRLVADYIAAGSTSDDAIVSAYAECMADAALCAALDGSTMQAFAERLKSRIDALPYDQRIECLRHIEECKHYTGLAAKCHVLDRVCGKREVKDVWFSNA